MFTTVEDIAVDFVSQLHPEDLEAIATNFSSYEPMVRIWSETGIMRAIRNEYGLWWDNPLTEKWRTDEAGRDIRDGVDFSEDHPDNVSSVIYKRVKELTKARLAQE